MSDNHPEIPSVQLRIYASILSRHKGGSEMVIDDSK